MRLFFATTYPVAFRQQVQLPNILRISGMDLIMEGGRLKPEGE